jgi:hypothetical protein
VSLLWRWRAGLAVGSRVDACDNNGRWYEAEVISLNYSPGADPRKVISESGVVRRGDSCVTLASIRSSA